MTTPNWNQAHLVQSHYRVPTVRKPLEPVGTARADRFSCDCHGVSVCPDRLDRLGDALERALNLQAACRDAWAQKSPEGRCDTCEINVAEAREALHFYRTGTVLT
jgi:hypothetical protein